MARWTENILDVHHFARVNQELWKALEGGCISKVQAKDGREFEGILAGESVGNNAGTMKPASSYYGDVRLRTLDGVMLEIDLLDVQTVANFT